jgi:outer membrane protein
MMRKKVLSCLIAMSVITAPTYADTIGFEVGVSAWQTDLEGTLDSIEELGDLDVDSEIAADLYFNLELPFPGVPDFRLATTSVDHQIDDVAIDSMEYQHTDLILYWQPVDSVVELDLGFGVRQLDVSVIPTSGGPPATEYDDIDPTLLMFYLKFQGNLPVIGLSIGALVQAGADSDYVASDLDVYFRYESTIGLGVGLGYRQVGLNGEFDGETVGIETFEADIDTSLEGAYLNVFYHF